MPKGIPLSKEIHFSLRNVGFNYSALDSSKNEIRFLSLLPSRRTLVDDVSEGTAIHDVLGGWPSPPQTKVYDPVRCVLRNFSLNDLRPEYSTYRNKLTPNTLRSGVLGGWINQVGSSGDECRYTWGDYNALSYTWGDPTNTRIVYVNDQEFAVTINLEAALRVLRNKYASEPRLHLWVDAICINQNDIDERNLQVKRMGEIYSQAFRVDVWLGEFSDETLPDRLRITAALIEKHGASEQIHSMLEHSSIRSHPPYREVFKQPYLKRLWVIQDILLGSDKTIVWFGTWEAPWSTLDIFVGFLGRSNHLDPEDGDNMPAVWQALNMSFLRHIFLSKPLEDISKSGNERQDAEFLLTMLFDVAAAATATDARDKVYGLLGLLPSSIVSKITPDYTSSIESIYLSFTKAVIEEIGVLDWIFLQPAVSNPSWLSDLRLKPSVEIQYMRSSRGIKPTDNRRTRVCFLDGNKFLRCQAAKVDEVDGVAACTAAEALDIDLAITQPTQSSPAHPLYITDDNLRAAIQRVLGFHPQQPPESPFSLFTIPWTDASPEIYAPPSGILLQRIPIKKIRSIWMGRNRVFIDLYSTTWISPLQRSVQLLGPLFKESIPADCSTWAGSIAKSASCG